MCAPLVSGRSVSLKSRCAFHTAEAKRINFLFAKMESESVKEVKGMFKRSDAHRICGH